MLGVNLSGGEYWRGGNIYGTSYIFPSNAEIDYYASKGMDVIRVPFQWERMQKVLNGAAQRRGSRPPEGVVATPTPRASRSSSTRTITACARSTARTTRWASTARRRPRSLADFWGRMAATFKGSNVFYDIMNEPHYQSAHEWAAGRQRRHQGDPRRRRHREDPGAGHQLDRRPQRGSRPQRHRDRRRPSIPKNNFAFEVHQYLDQRFLGHEPDRGVGEPSGSSA